MSNISVSSFTGNGLRDWLLQRITAVIIALYSIGLIIYVACQPQFDFAMWRALFQHLSMRVLTVVFLLSVVVHAWIGVWTVLTDYIKPTLLRLLLQILVAIGCFLFVVWGIAILWSF